MVRYWAIFGIGTEKHDSRHYRFCPDQLSDEVPTYHPLRCVWMVWVKQASTQRWPWNQSHRKTLGPVGTLQGNIHFAAPLRLPGVKKRRSPSSTASPKRRRRVKPRLRAFSIEPASITARMLIVSTVVMPGLSVAFTSLTAWLTVVPS